MNVSRYDERQRDLPNTVGMTYRQIGARWNVSASRAMQIVRRLERNAAHRVIRAEMPHPLTDEWLLEDMGLSARTVVCLRNENIMSVGDVRGLTDRQLMSIPNFGRKSLREVRDAIREGFTPR